MKECPENFCGKKASFPISDLPSILLPPGQNVNITIPDDWMARLVISKGSEGFGYYFNTRERFSFVVKDWSYLPTVRYSSLTWGDQYREPEHEIQASYGPHIP